MNKDRQAVHLAAGGVLAPMSLDVFFKDYWEQKPLHINRSTENPFASLISIDDIESLLSTNSLRYPTLQLSHAGQQIPISEYADSDNRIVASRVIERYKQGSTIVLTHAHRLSSNLMALCRAIQSSMMMRCQTNVYLSPAGNQGFNPHYDTHDVFILQVSGTKTFNFYSTAAESPTSTERFNSELHNVGDKTEEIVLVAGDTLYIPRGIVHDALADSKEPSLHVTLGVYPVLLQSLLNEITQTAYETDARLRRAISQQVWMQGESPKDTTHILKEILQDKINDQSVHDALVRLRDELALDAVQDCSGQLSGTNRLGVEPSAVLVIHRHKILQIERIEHSVIVRTFGHVLEFPDPVGAAVAWLLEQDSVQIHEIHDLEQEQVVALIEQLQGDSLLSIE